MSVEEDCEKAPLLAKMFGSSVKGKESISCLIFRDAMLDEENFKKDFTDKSAIMYTSYTEVKYENTIDRKFGTTQPGDQDKLKEFLLEQSSILKSLSIFLMKM